MSISLCLTPTPTAPLYTYTHEDTCTYKYTYTHIYIHPQVHIHLHIHTPTYTYIHPCIYIHPTYPTLTHTITRHPNYNSYYHLLPCLHVQRQRAAHHCHHRVRNNDVSVRRRQCGRVGGQRKPLGRAAQGLSCAGKVQANRPRCVHKKHLLWCS